jgi:hypothetical protein
MEMFLLILLIAAVVWLAWQSQTSKSRLEELDSRMASFEDRIRQLNRDQTPAAATPAPPPLPAQLLDARQAMSAEPTPEAAPAAAMALTSSTIAEPVPPPPLLEAPPVEPAPAPVVPSFQPAAAANAGINWENFLGVKLFAWIGGLLLFLGVAFFIKYAFQNNLISPQLRVAAGYLAGLGLVAGALLIPRERHAVTVHTLCATGTVILYANIFASHAYYHFIGPTPAFSLMALVTATAFLLAVRLEAQVIAILGLLGGFLTPPLLSTGVDHPLGLFGYLGLLDIGLIAVALRQRWNYQILLAAAATAVMQAGWVMKFFEAEKVLIAMGVFLGFSLLFVTAFGLAHRLKSGRGWSDAAAILMPAAALVFVLYLFAHPYPVLAQRAVLLFSFVFLADLGLLAVAWLRDDLRLVHAGAGIAVFFILSAWTVHYLTPELLNIALGCYLLFAVLHSVFPVILQRVRPTATPLWWIHLYPPAALLLIMVPLLNITTSLSWLVWPVVLIIDLMAIALAVITASMVSILTVFLLTVIATALWIFQLPAELPEAPGMLVVIGGFAVFFMVAGLLAARRHFTRFFKPVPAGEAAPAAATVSPVLTPQLFTQLAALAALLPFLLLSLVVLRLPLVNPSPVFGLAALLSLLLLGVVRFYSVDLLAAVGLLSVLLVEYVWHFQRFTTDHVGLATAWHVGFGAVFLVFPFLFQSRMEQRVIPWAVSALALPLHFLVVYRSVTAAIPNYAWLGLVPAAFAVPCLLGLLRLVRRIPPDGPARQPLLALFGGATLFFITLVFPIQFENQWLTLSWALEGAALLWLFHRVPQAGLRLVGVGLLAVTFVRLALNPAVLEYRLRGDVPILNWYLYSYGITAACLLAGARLLAPPRHSIHGLNAPPLLYTLGTILAFLLLNIEIADSFTAPGTRLAFRFSSSVEQDMTYSLSWGVFAFALLAIGFKTRNAPTRFAGMGLLVVTILKLFLHDLWQLGGLYRIGSLVGLAVLLILISFIYQRFLSSDAFRKPASASAGKEHQ